MKIGYICMVVQGEKENFEYQEASCTRTIGTRTDKVRCKFLYPQDYEDVMRNTEMLKNNTGIMIVREPFFTDEELKKRCLKWCEWANSCENREYSFSS